MRTNRFQGLSKGLRRERGQKNKGEAEYALRLDADPEVARYWFEPFSLRLSSPETGTGARYTPDFLVLMNDGRTFVDDVKSSGNFDDPAAIVRIKCAAELYPLWVFRIAKRRAKKNGGGFEIVEV